MKKRRSARGMTNLQPFPYPVGLNTWFNKNLSKNDSLQNIEIKVFWGSLLGKDNEEIITSSLYNSPKFIAHIEATRQDFLKNRNNLRKYPKLKENDWK
jgi:hypothetical protein